MPASTHLYREALPYAARYVELNNLPEGHAHQFAEAAASTAQMRGDSIDATIARLFPELLPAVELEQAA
jgi:hypothetical protein